MAGRLPTASRQSRPIDILEEEPLGAEMGDRVELGSRGVLHMSEHAKLPSTGRSLPHNLPEIVHFNS